MNVPPISGKTHQHLPVIHSLQWYCVFEFGWLAAPFPLWPQIWNKCNNFLCSVLINLGIVVATSKMSTEGSFIQNQSSPTQCGWNTFNKGSFFNTFYNSFIFFVLLFVHLLSCDTWMHLSSILFKINLAWFILSDLIVQSFEENSSFLFIHMDLPAYIIQIQSLLNHEEKYIYERID